LKTKTKMLLRTKVALGGLGAFAFLVLAIIGFLYYLSSGNGFSHPQVTSRLESLLNERLPSDVKAKIGTSRFQNTEAGLSIMADDVSFIADKTTVFTAPRINLLFDPVGFLKSGENPYLRTIEVVGATLDVKKSDQEIDFKPLGLALKKLRESSFTSVNFKNLTVNGNVFSLTLNRLSEKNLVLDLTDIAKVNLLFINDQTRLDFTLNDTRLSSFKAFLHEDYNPERVDFALNGAARLLLNNDGSPIAFESDIKLSDGKFEKKGKHPKIYVLRDAALRLSWAEGRDSMNIEQFSLDMHPYKGEMKGVISRKGFLITGGRLAVLGGANEPPVVLSQIVMKGGFDLDKQELLIERAELSGAEVALTASGRIVFKTETPGLYLDIETKPMPAWAYLRLWPEIISPNSRQWIVEHMKAGQAEASFIKTAIPPGQFIPDHVVLDREMLLIKAKVTKGVLKPLKDMGYIRADSLSIHVDGKEVKVETNAAVLEVNGAKPLDASYIMFYVPDIAPENPSATLVVKAKGDVKSLAILLKSETFKGISAFDLDPDSAIKGQAAVNVTLAMVLRPTLQRTDMKYKADLEFTGFSQKNVVRDLDLEGAIVKITATPGEFSLKGEGKIGGQQASFDYKKADKKPIIELRATLDEKGRTRFGLASGGRINGVTPVKIISKPDDEGVFLVEVDLTQAALNDLIPGWIKPLGVPAKAKLKANDLDPGWKIDDIIIEGRGVNVRGALTIDGDGQLVGGNFPTYQLHDGDKASVKVDRIAGGHRVILNAAVIDLRPIMKSLLASSSPVGTDKASPKGVLQIEAKVGAAAGNNGEMMRNIALKASRVNGEIKTADVTGRIGKGGFKITNMIEDKNNWLTVTADDAGAWLRFFNIYTNMQGGALRLATAPPKADGSISAGAVEITNFVIKGDEAIGGMVATTETKAGSSKLSLEERQRILSERVRERTGDNTTSFVRLKADFSRSANNIINVRDGLIWGVALGSTISGDLDFNKNTISMAGTYVPAYALNNIFAKLPIIGIFLGGNTDEGLIGVNYAITGTIAAPQLTINPLSILAPGFLRRILDFRGGNQN
jgi:hypothetical protein